jgi:hypothetical protein
MEKGWKEISNKEQDKESFKLNRPPYCAER